MNNETKEKKFIRPSLVLFSLLFFVVPNVNIIDILPDFIAFFLLARAFSKLSDCVPYMEEARASFVKLAFIDLFRFFCQFFVLSATGSSLYDTMALFSLMFAVLRVIFVFGAVRYVFDALFYLGERTDIPALISPFGLFGKKITPEFLKTFTLAFFVGREALFCIPDIVRAFSARQSRAYIVTLLLFSAIALLAGIAFYVFVARYIRAIRKEGKWHNGVYGLFLSHLPSYNEHLKKRRIQTAFIFIFVSTIFTLYFPVDTFANAELLPSFLFPFFLTLGLVGLSRYSDFPGWIVPLGILSSLTSLLTFILRPVYFSKFSAEDLVLNASADTLYLKYIVCAVVECLVTLIFLALLHFTMSRKIESETGLPKGAPGYRQADEDYHKTLKLMNLCFTLLGCITTVTRTIKVILDYNIVPSTLTGSDGSQILTYSGQMPWFVVIVNASAIFFALFAYYYTAVLKEEWRVTE